MDVVKTLKNMVRAFFKFESRALFPFSNLEHPTLPHVVTVRRKHVDATLTLFWSSNNPLCRRSDEIRSIECLFLVVFAL